MYGAHETKALSWKCFDKTLLLAGVADRASDGVQPRRQRRIRYNPTIPNRDYEIVLADDAFAVAHQVDQEVEDFRPNRNNLRPPGELPPVRVKHAVSEHKMHFGAPWPPRADVGRAAGADELGPLVR